MRMMMTHILSSHQIDFLVFNVKLSVSVDISVAWVAAVVDSMNNNIKIKIAIINSMNKNGKITITITKKIDGTSSHCR